MLNDPLADWDGPCPYDALAEVGVGPRSTMDEIRAASFALQASGRFGVARSAWDRLRIVERRLLVDLLLYDVDISDAPPAPLPMDPRQPATWAELESALAPLTLPPIETLPVPELENLPEPPWSAIIELDG